MKICLVGPGLKPIPPSGWGAVESLVWDYYETLKSKGVQVEISNHSSSAEMVRFINAGHFSVVHIMYDDHIYLAPYIKTESTHILYTSHFAYITDPDFAGKCKWYYDRIFMEVVRSQHLLSCVNTISDKIGEIYCANGLARDKIKTLSNGAREDKFAYHIEPLRKDKSVYLAKIEMRKKQYVYQTISSIDFVGNYQDSTFDLRRPNYLGEWTKDILYKNLSHYGNLVLLSDGEADPLVVKEALICGLGVVLSE
jgi:glycosyltransferase involved in cell wall biosynthesis